MCKASALEPPDRCWRQVQAVMVDHHNCRLGKWYDSGNGAKLFGAMPSYGKLEPPHQTVHSSIHEAIGYIHQDWSMDGEIQEKMFSCFSKAELASQDIIKSIDQLVVERRKTYTNTNVNTDTVKPESIDDKVSDD